MGERTEERPDGRDGHGDEDDPFFDLAPQEKNSDAVCRLRLICFEPGVREYLTGGVVGEDEFGGPCSDDCCDTGEDTAAHEEAQAPF